MAERTTSPAMAQAGLGTLCPESQADGVPCSCLGLDCVMCSERTARPPDHAAPRPGGHTTVEPAPARPDA